MRRNTLVRTTLAVAAISLAVSPAGARSAGSGAQDCGDGHSVTWTPSSIWPPNHKMQTVTLVYRDADPDHDLALAVDGVGHDEMLPDGSELPGAGNTPDDWTVRDPGGTGKGSVDAKVDVRAERSGTGDGRVYSIDYTATSMNEDGEVDDQCSGTATIAVPHDCRRGSCKVYAKP